MRILWFSNTSSNFDIENQIGFSGGWISELERNIVGVVEIEELAVSFFYSCNKKVKRDKITYYAIRRRERSNLFVKFIFNWIHFIGNKKDLKRCIKVVDDFKPDIIHVFGTESVFGMIAKFYPDRTIIHLQGLVNPILNAYFPPHISLFDVLWYGNWFNFIVGNGRFHDYLRFKLIAARELEIFKDCKYYLGRTTWDRQYINLLVPSAKYFYNSELLRVDFSSVQWKLSKNELLTISTIINSNLYKGLDLILITSNVIKHTWGDRFIWHIFGINKTDEVVAIFENKLRLRFGDNNVVFHGSQPAKTLVDGLLCSDVFVHPSYIDNSPNSVCEAQLLGMPVICTNVGGVGSLIETGRNGILIPANDPYYLAKMIIDIKKNDYMAHSLGAEARKTAQIRHNTGDVINGIVSVYKDLCH